MAGARCAADTTLTYRDDYATVLPLAGPIGHPASQSERHSGELLHAWERWHTGPWGWSAARQCMGCCPYRPGDTTLDTLHLVGPGMHRLMLSRPDTAAYPTHHTLSLPGYTPFLAPTTVWSRTIGALGGEAVWQRLVGLRVAIIGVGRTGSLVATTLARVGLTQVTLIDPDEIEPHNLGEMDSVKLTDVQRYKVDAVAATLRGDIALPYPALAVPVTADTARRACLQADVLISCVDNDAARLATAIMATLYHKVLLDLGTGIALQPVTGDASVPPERMMGADVRLILPGDGCLLCRGQLTNLAGAVDDLQHQRPLGRPQDWQTQRAGSLRTLNQLAAALGVQLLQDLVTERVQETTWAHLTFDPHGRLTVQYPPAPAPNAAAPCVLCTRAGLGDAGWAWTV